MCHFFPFLLFIFLVNSVRAKFLFNHYRANRHCTKEYYLSKQKDDRGFIRENPFTFIFLLIFALLLLLILLGIIKGLIGILCSPYIGIFGLKFLIDLPRPLNVYQEKQLRDRVVIYDSGGWPLHPDTLERTVRVLTKRTEFCLNTIFFLAYPLAAITYLCALCCCIKNYKKSDENVRYKRVNKVKLTTCSKNDVDVYNENDNKEEEDTKYVVDQMRKSQHSLLSSQRNPV